MRSRDNVKVYLKKLAMWEAYFAHLKDICQKSKLIAQEVKSKSRTVSKITKTMKGNK